MQNFYPNIGYNNVYILSKKINNAISLGKYCPNIAQTLSKVSKYCLRHYPNSGQLFAKK